MAFPPYSPSSVIAGFSIKTLPTSGCPQVKPYLPAQTPAERQQAEKTPFAQPSSRPLASPTTAKATLKIPPCMEMICAGTCPMHLRSPECLPCVAAQPRGAPTQAPWAPGLSASSLAAAPRSPWGFGFVPLYLRALWHSRAHPSAVPSRRMFAECLQVARQRSGELIFLLIKGSKTSLFLNREKTTEGRAQKLLLS